MAAIKSNLTQSFFSEKKSNPINLESFIEKLSISILEDRKESLALGGTLPRKVVLYGRLSPRIIDKLTEKYIEALNSSETREEELIPEFICDSIIESEYFARKKHNGSYKIKLNSREDIEALNKYLI